MKFSSFEHPKIPIQQDHVIFPSATNNSYFRNHEPNISVGLSQHET